jgi:predicted ArsR family transcriptional regulator
MSRKSGLEIKKTILHQLKKKDCSFRELETKVNTNYITIRKHCEELSYFGFIELKQMSVNERNGRPYTLVHLTEKGKAL